MATQWSASDRYLPSTISKNECLLVAIGHPKAAVPYSARSGRGLNVWFLVRSPKAAAPTHSRRCYHHRKQCICTAARSFATSYCRQYVSPLTRSLLEVIVPAGYSTTLWHLRRTVMSTGRRARTGSLLAKLSPRENNRPPPEAAHPSLRSKRNGSLRHQPGTRRKPQHPPPSDASQGAKAGLGMDLLLRQDHRGGLRPRDDHADMRPDQ
jgi:hypothetical protein